MATLRKRGDRWHCQVRKKGYEPQTKSFRTRAEAERWARLIESEIDGGAFVRRKEAESTTLLEVIDRYEREVTPRKRGALQERSSLSLLRKTSLSRRFLSSIRTGDVSSLRDEWLQQGLARATVLRRLALISHIFNVCRLSWHFESLVNPVDLIEKPTPDNARSRRLAAHPDAASASDEEAAHDRRASDDELHRILKVTGSSVLRDAVVFAVETAMRRGEIASLLWSNVDTKRRFAHLPETKNGTSRDVPLSPAAVALLQKMPVNISGRVFAMRADALTRAFQRSVVRARRLYEEECTAKAKTPDPQFLVGLRFHDLRHEATSRLAAIFQMHELAKITGHRDPRMLLRYYHPRAEDLAKKFAEVA